MLEVGLKKSCAGLVKWWAQKHCFSIGFLMFQVFIELIGAEGAGGWQRKSWAGLMVWVATETMFSYYNAGFFYRYFGD